MNDSSFLLSSLFISCDAHSYQVIVLQSILHQIIRKTFEAPLIFNAESWSTIFTKNLSNIINLPCFLKFSFIIILFYGNFINIYEYLLLIYEINNCAIPGIEMNGVERTYLQVHRK